MDSLNQSLNPITLLPCPHCGEGESMVECYKNDNGYWSVGCGRCGAHSGSLPDTAYKDAKERVIKGWNKRAQPSEICDNGNAAALAAQDWVIINGGVITISEAADLVDAIRPHLRTAEPVSRHLEVLKNVVRFADGRCWPEVQAAIDANRELLKHED